MGGDQLMSFLRPPMVYAPPVENRLRVSLSMRTPRVLATRAKTAAQTVADVVVIAACVPLYYGVRYVRAFRRRRQSGVRVALRRTARSPGRPRRSSLTVVGGRG